MENKKDSKEDEKRRKLDKRLHRISMIIVYSLLACLFLAMLILAYAKLTYQYPGPTALIGM